MVLQVEESGSALEYYDFALYTLAAALIFGPLFFPEQTRTMSLIASQTLSDCGQANALLAQARAQADELRANARVQEFVTGGPNAHKRAAQ